jgi:hypothetical protein
LVQKAGSKVLVVSRPTGRYTPAEPVGRGVVRLGSRRCRAGQPDSLPSPAAAVLPRAARVLIPSWVKLFILRKVRRPVHLVLRTNLEAILPYKRQYAESRDKPSISQLNPICRACLRAVSNQEHAIPFSG